MEGLTKYWGFYFVAGQDVNFVGVNDLEKALQGVASYMEWVSDLSRLETGAQTAQNETNIRIAAKAFKKVVVARIVVFDLFLELVIATEGSLLGKHRRTWLLFQLSDALSPGDRGTHPFIRIGECLNHASERDLDEMLGRLRRVLQKYLPRSSLIFALDEAQVAMRLYPNPFLSSTNTQAFRSVLREIVRVFTRLPVKLVVSGTGLSLAEVSESLNSGVGKLENFELFHNLGMFDTWPKMKATLQKYIPPSVLESHSGGRLQQRIWEYLSGR